MKVCKKCGEAHSCERFQRHAETADRLHPWCKQCCTSYQRAKRAERGAEATREINARWRTRNPEKVRDLRARAAAKKKLTPEGRLTLSVRSYLSQNLAQRGAAKRSRTFHALGYTAQDLARHVESAFQDGMTWDNYGEWHLDHIKPLAAFSYESTDCLQFKAAWGLDNLQPLWAKDNLAKGARLA